MEMNQKVLEDIDTYTTEIKLHLIVLASIVGDKWSYGRIYVLPDGALWSIKTDRGMHQSLQIEVNDEEIVIDGKGLVSKKTDSPHMQSWDMSGVFSIGDPDSIEKAINLFNRIVDGTRIFDES